MNHKLVGAALTLCLMPRGGWAQDSDECLDCHDDSSLVGERYGREISMNVDPAVLANSAHKQTACVGCHVDLAGDFDGEHDDDLALVDCGICHAPEVDLYESGVHGQLTAKGDPDAPRCLDCHATHATQSARTPTSPTFPRNEPELCARCHRQGEKAAKRIHDDQLEIVDHYGMSIHGKGLLQSGLVVSATCSDCHGAHDPRHHDDPKSRVHHDNIARTCGKCHDGMEEALQTSVHWPGNVETDRELPSCADCHTSHTISRTDLGDFRLRMMNQCGRCHQPESETFFDTFHGKVSRLEVTGAASCHDCHGTHDIRSPSDPESTLGQRRVVETCAQCHQGAHQRFTGYLSHATHHDRDKYPWLFWTFWLMAALIAGTLTVALLHALAWLVRLWLDRKQWQRHSAAAGEKLYKRFTAGERAMHFALLLSFFTLALTGMVLKFSYMAWAQSVAGLVGGFRTTGTLHRLGAILLLVLFVIHLLDLRRRKRERGISWLQLITGPSSLLFNRNDLRELVASLKWFVGLGPRPSYGRYTYWEKFDYFAVFWGIAVIGSSGLVLWFPELFTYVLPGLSINVATIIHSDEALLAVAFIFTVHFFNSHLRPDKFPMDPVIFTGRMPLAELRHDKPREYQERVAAGDLEDHLVDAYPRPVERAFKLFGLGTLVVGLTLIGLIVYTMLLGWL